MADLTFVDQSAANLQLTVIGGEVDHSQFTLLRQGKLEIGGYRFQAGIIGASHFFELRRGENVLTEVLACTEVVAPKGVAYGPMKDLKWGKVEQVIHGFHYKIELSIVPLPSPEFWRKKAQTENPSELGLFYEFPSPTGVKGIAFTAVHACLNYGFAVTTCHAYPQEGRAVVSKTILLGGN